MGDLKDLYPSSSFWSTYKSHQHHSGMPRVDEPTSTEDNLYLEVVSESKDARGFTIQCSEVDGVALGSWNTTATQDDDGVDEDNSAAGYLVLAAVWLHSWDQRTVDRVILDQSLVTGEHTSWGAQLEYHVVHHNWPQVSALLDAIPHSVMYEGELQVHLGFDETVVLGEADPDVEEAFSPKGGNKEVKTVIPNVHILGIDMRPMSSAWLWHMMDMKLIKNHIFLRTHWQGTAELVSLLASAGLLFHHTSSGDFDNVGKQQSADGMGVHKDSLHKDTVQAFHELVVQHSVKHSLMNLLECYCNHHSLALDEGSATMMQAILVGSHWAECMVLSRLEDHEYDASFANAQAILPDTIATVDDMAASGRPYMAMATLMYAPCPLQKCLILGDVNRHSGQSSACSLASLQQELKSFPTLWLMLVTAVHGQDAWSFLRSSPETGTIFSCCLTCFD
jgi:spatacsin